LKASSLQRQAGVLIIGGSYFRDPRQIARSCVPLPNVSKLSRVFTVKWCGWFGADLSMTQQELQDVDQAASEKLDPLSLPYSLDEVTEALRRVLASDLFLRSERLTHFLGYIVEKTLHGQSGDLKEYHIGVAVCGRKNSYDTRTDPVVRVEARRLRSALDLYYAQEGKEDAVRISLPKGGYVPSFFFCQPDAPQPAQISKPAPASRQILRWGWPLALAGTFLLAGGVYFFWTQQHRHLSANTSTLVLADFANTTGEVIFDHALRQGLAAQLEQSPYLSLLSDAQIAQTLALMGKEKDTHLTEDLAREVCERTGKAVVIDGSIATLGNQYVLGLRAIDCHTGEILDTEQAQADSKEHVLDAMAKSAAKLRRHLGESLASVQKYDAPPENVTTASLEALQAYSLGFKVHVVKLDEAAAADLFQRAIALDPKFAMAYARLAVCNINMGELGLAAKNLRSAYDLRTQVSQHEELFILSLYHQFVTGNLDETRKTYELRSQIYAHDDIPVGNAGNVYFLLGQYDRALDATLEAMRRNPGSRIWNGNLVSSFIALGKLPEAKAAAESARARQLDSPWLHICLYLIAYEQADTQEMARQAAQLNGVAEFQDILLDYQAQAAAREGRLNEARSISERAVRMALEANQPDSASLYLAQAAIDDAWAGNRAQARKQAQKALQISSGREGEAVAAVALAIAGDSAEALRLAGDLTRRFPENTMVRDQYVPTIRAAATLHSGAPVNNAAAILDELAPALPNEFGSHAMERVAYLTCYSIYFRGEAYLAARRGVEAAAEFQKVLDRPQLTLTDPVSAMATLGIARAYELSGDRAKSFAASKSFQNLRKNADAGIVER
jgi:eukaryotic-like serine/threonine-protein kinase